MSEVRGSEEKLKLRKLKGEMLAVRRDATTN